MKTMRWQQRFRNMQKALMLLSEAVERNNLNRLEQEG
jgi:hypothetical protein